MYRHFVARLVAGVILYALLAAAIRLLGLKTTPPRPGGAVGAARAADNRDARLFVGGGGPVLAVGQLGEEPGPLAE